jgi:hypothetical protein
MPDRYVRAGILTSERVNTLSWAEEVFYRRLMSAVDDYGRFDARNAILRAELYPLKVDSVREADIATWKRRAAEAGLIVLYQVDGREFLQIQNFRQRTRSPSKFPEPSPLTSADKCQQVSDIRPQMDDTCGLNSRSRSNAQVEDDNPPTPHKGGERFSPPTFAEVRDYCQGRGNAVDPQAFVDFYASKGWMIGKNRMKDWQACVRTWEKNHGRTNGTHSGTGGSRSATRIDGTDLLAQLEAEVASAGDAGCRPSADPPGGAGVDP